MLRRKQRQLIAAVVTFIMLAVATVGFYMLPVETGPGSGGLGLIYGLVGTAVIVLDIAAGVFLVCSIVEGICDWIDRGPR